MKKREIVESLRKENEQRSDISENRQGKFNATSTDISSLQDEATKILKRIEIERKKIDELDQSIEKCQEKLVEQKSRVGGSTAAQTNNQLIKKQLKVLEGRMDKGLVKFNELLAQNKSIRGKIDEFRKERVVYDGIYKKLERELFEKKREMSAIIEDSKNAYQSKDKSEVEIHTLEKQANKEKHEFERYLKAFGELIKQQQQHYYEQLRIKRQESSHDPLVVSASTNIVGENEAINSKGNWSVGMGLSAKDKSSGHSQEINNQSYEDMLRFIQESTGIYDIHEIVAQFSEAEEQNFSLFNYVNDINSEIERLEHAISDMRNQIEKFRGQGLSTDSQRKKTRKDLDEKLDRTLSKAAECESHYHHAFRTISQLKNGIQNIFTRIGATSASLDEKQGITEANMMQYLGIIEQRTSEILQAYAASQPGLQNDIMMFPSVGLMNSNTSSTNNNQQQQQQHHTGDQITIVNPNTAIPTQINAKRVQFPPILDEIGSYSSDDSEGEEDERPLTRLELEKRTLKELSKKKNTNPGSGGAVGGVNHIPNNALSAPSHSANPSSGEGNNNNNINTNTTTTTNNNNNNNNNNNHNNNNANKRISLSEVSGGGGVREGERN